MIVIGAALAIGGMVVTWIARATARGDLGRNTVAGIRSSATMRSDDAWAAAHEAGKTATLVGGVSAVAGGLLLVLVRPSSNAVALAMVVVPTVLLLGGVLWGAHLGTKAAKQVAD